MGTPAIDARTFARSSAVFKNLPDLREEVRNLRKEIEQLYPAIFNPFRNVNPITRFWRTWDCDFVTFQTGYYTADADGGNVFSEGPDTYPRNLWNTILKRCRG